MKFFKNLSKWKKAAILLILAAAVCAAVFAYTGGKAQTVDRTEAAAGPVKDTYTVTGTVSAGTETYIISEVSGSISEILVTANSELKEGDVILRVDPSNYEYQLDQAKAQLSAYEAQQTSADIGRLMTASPSEYLTAVRDELELARTAMEEAQKAYDAAAELFDAGAASEDDVRKAKMAFDSANEQYKAAEQRNAQSSKVLRELSAQGISESSLNSTFYSSEKERAKAMADAQRSVVEQLEEQIEKCEIRAPFDGKVTRIPAEGMSMAAAGQTIAVMKPEDAGVIIEADVLTSIAPYLKKGDPVNIKMDFRGGSSEFSGKISEVYDYAVEDISALGLKEYKVHIKIQPDDPAGFTGLAGYSAQVALTLYSEENVLSVPSSAVFESGGAHYVYAVANGSAVKKEVETGYSSPSRTVILSGLSDGESIIDKVENEGIYEGASVKYGN